MSVFLVVYTISGFIAAVSYPLPAMDQCNSIADVRTDQQRDDKEYHNRDPNAPHYLFECEEHKSRPKVTTKIDARDKSDFESVTVSDSLTARRASYSISGEGIQKCIYRDANKIFCADGTYLDFERHVRTRDYDLIVVSLPGEGNGIRFWDWKLVIDDGRRAIVKPLADQCIDCDIRVEKLKPHSNQADFVYRQKQNRVSVRFNDGALSIHKSKLDPREPLSEEHCHYFYLSFKACYQHDSCTIGIADAGYWFMMTLEDKYAGISYNGIDKQCEKACSTDKAMDLDRSTFFNDVCRRHNL
jgi:hypothetical protein